MRITPTNSGAGAKLRNLVILAWTIFAAAQSFAAAPQDPLWRKAIDVTRQNKAWIPGLTVMRSEVLQGGEAAGVHEIWQRSKAGTNGQVVSEIVKVLEDGKDVTAKEKKSKQVQAPTSFDMMLFSPKAQRLLAVTPTERTRRITERECVAFEFQHQSPKGPTLKGIAWLEKETGRPVELENMTFDPLPDKMKKMAITTRYAATPEGGWQVKETIMKGVAGFLFIKAEFQTTMSFSEYWKKPQPEAVSRRDE